MRKKILSQKQAGQEPAGGRPRRGCQSRREQPLGRPVGISDFHRPGAQRRSLEQHAALQREISGRIGALTDRVGQETVQEVSRALQGQADAIQRKTNEFEQQANRLEEVMESQAQRVEKSQERFFAFNTWQTRIFWGGWVCNIFTLILLIFVALTK